MIHRFDSSFGRIKDERVRCALMSFVTTIFFFIFFVWRHELSFPFDSGYYWNEADAVFSEGFSLLSFPETFRGYFLPIFYGALKKAGSIFGYMGSYYLFWFVRSIIYGLFFSIIIPGLFQMKKVTGRVFIGVIISLLMIFYFIEDIPYPLTDTASFVTFSSAVFFGLRAWESKDIKWIATFGFLTGFLLYLAYNIRILNLYGMALLMIYYVASVAVKLRTKVGPSFVKCRCWFVLALLLGAFIAAVPQMLINHHYRGTYTPRVLYEELQNYEGTQELMELQSGVERYKYDTYIGTNLEYPYSGIAYQDAAGEYLLKKVQGEFSVGKMLTMFIHYPMDMIGVYGRNLFSLMTITTGDYITNFHENQNLRFLMVVIMWIMTAIVVFVSWPHLFETLIRRFYIVGMLIPAVLEISDAPEIRFFYPVYFCIFAVLCYAGNLSKTFKFIKEHFFYVFVAGSFVLVLWSGVYGNVLMENGANIPRLIGDKRVKYQEDVLYQGDVSLTGGVDGQGYVDLVKLSDMNHISESAIYQVSFRPILGAAEFYIVVTDDEMSEVRGITTYYNPETKRYEGAIALSQGDLPLKFMLIYNSSENVTVDDLKIASLTNGDL